MLLWGVVVDDFTITIKEIPFRVHFTVKALFAIKIHFRKNYSTHVQFCKKSSFLYINFIKYNFYELYENELWYIDYNIYWLWQSMLSRSIQFNVNKIKYENSFFLHSFDNFSRFLEMHLNVQLYGTIHSWVKQGFQETKIKINFFHIALESCLNFFHFSNSQHCFMMNIKFSNFKL